MKTTFCIIALLFLVKMTPAVRARAQASVDSPQLRRRCTTLAVTSDNPALPSELFVTYLQQRADFQASKLQVTSDVAAADAVVRLSPDCNGETAVIVTNRLDDRRVKITSNWTNYPGMVALDAIDALKTACPGSVVDLTPHPATTSCSEPHQAYFPVRSLTGCSHTSWMDDRGLYKVLRSSRELQQQQVAVLPSCTSAEATIEVTHNLDQTVRWHWRLQSHGTTLASGYVIAYKASDAGTKITAAVAREIVVAKRENSVVTTAIPRTTPAASLQHKLSVRLLPSDFSVQDKQLELYVDNEGVSAHDARGNLVFSFRMQDFRDARLKTEWETPLQLEFPGALVAATASAGSRLFEQQTIRGVALPFNHFPLFTTDSISLIGYASIDAVLAQVRTPWHRLELAWETEGLVRTVALEVPNHGTSELVRDLRRAAAVQKNPCDGVNVLVASRP